VNLKTLGKAEDRNFAGLDHVEDGAVGFGLQSLSRLAPSHVLGIWAKYPVGLTVRDL